jgi:hypothetical protein
VAPLTCSRALEWATCGRLAGREEGRRQLR